MRGGAAAQRPSAADGAAEHGEQIFFRKMREAVGDVAVFGRARGVILQRLIVVRLAAAEQDGVIIYSDLIKVRVCAETAKVIGVEAAGYFTNHTERVIAKPALTVKQAKAKVFSGIDVITSRLAVRPVGENSEKLCYEFSGTYDGSTYYVYIDAATGRQVEMFKVIKSTEGELLM